MTKHLTIRTGDRQIPAILCCPDRAALSPAVIMCHGTGSHKDEVGGLFASLADSLLAAGIASIRFDFAGCGESTAPQQELTFLGEVDDTECVYQWLCDCPSVDPTRIGVLGFSQGARVMAEFLRRMPDIPCAVSWSGACHDGRGVFALWFDDHYSEAQRHGYARIPLDWREDLLVARAWFDEIERTTPMSVWPQYRGAVLALAGTADLLVPYRHAADIAAACANRQSRAVLLDGADHTFNILTADKTAAQRLLRETVDWFCTHL